MNRQFVALLVVMIAFGLGRTIAAQQAKPDPIALGANEYRTFLPAVLSAAQQTPDTFYTGDGTYYNATGAGSCSFDPSPDDLMVAALNAPDYNNAAWCGAFVEVTGPRGTVTVRIVDLCPECKTGDLDLSREAFARIADPIAGRVPIRWRIVSPALSGPIVYHFKDGSNPWWTAVQIRNHRNPIARFEYRTADGSFKTVPRVEYNYFVETAGMGPGPYTFRVTDIYGNTLTDSGIEFLENGDRSGSAQFPPKP
jgi:expansin